MTTSQKLVLSSLNPGNGTASESYDLGFQLLIDETKDDIKIVVDATEGSIYLTLKGAANSRSVVAKISKEKSKYDFVKQIGGISDK